MADWSVIINIPRQPDPAKWFATHIHDSLLFTLTPRYIDNVNDMSFVHKTPS